MFNIGPQHDQNSFQSNSTCENNFENKTSLSNSNRRLITVKLEGLEEQKEKGRNLRCEKKRKEKGEPDESERKDEGRRRRRRKSQRLATVNECLSIYSCITLDFLFVNIKCHPNNLPTFLLRFCPFILTYWNIEVLHFLCQLFILVLCWKSLFLLCLLSPFR